MSGDSGHLESHPPPMTHPLSKDPGRNIQTIGAHELGTSQNIDKGKQEEVRRGNEENNSFKLIQHLPLPPKHHN